jgi:hypothetical protein
VANVAPNQGHLPASAFTKDIDDPREAFAAVVPICLEASLEAICFSPWRVYCCTLTLSARGTGREMAPIDKSNVATNVRDGCSTDRKALKDVPYFAVLSCAAGVPRLKIVCAPRAAGTAAEARQPHGNQPKVKGTARSRDWYESGVSLFCIHGESGLIGERVTRYGPCL